MTVRVRTERGLVSPSIAWLVVPFIVLGVRPGPEPRETIGNLNRHCSPATT